MGCFGALAKRAAAPDQPRSPNWRSLPQVGLRSPAAASLHLGRRDDERRALDMTMVPTFDPVAIEPPVNSLGAGFFRHPLLATVGRRLLFAIPLLLLVTLVTFVLMAMIPGDAATSIAGPTGTEAQVARLRTELGLNRPLSQQYWSWLSDALHGDLGQSVFTTE